MFDFAWSELAVIGVVALVAIGPKDMPVAIRTVAGFVKKARKMASEFQTHVDEMVREADLGDVKDSLNEIRNFDLKGTIEKAIDEDGSLREALKDPLGATSAAAEAVAEPAPPPPRWTPPAPPPPAFIPPGIAEPAPPPAFIPPNAVRH